MSRKKPPTESKIVRPGRLAPLGLVAKTPIDPPQLVEPSATKFDVAKTDAKDAKADADKKTDAPKSEPQLGDGPKSATSNEPPVAIGPAVAVSAPTPAPVDVEEPEDQPVRTRTKTVGMPAVADVGEPPAMPTVESPTHMPGGRDIPSGMPTDPALPPGAVPPGDSRSLRKDNEFALVYRQGTFVISRFGVVGQRGQWRVVEYPTSASASHSYAKECSRFVAEGFSDYRE